MPVTRGGDPGNFRILYLKKDCVAPTDPTGGPKNVPDVTCKLLTSHRKLIGKLNYCKYKKILSCTRRLTSLTAAPPILMR